jgi:hypothetical protein
MSPGNRVKRTGKYGNVFHFSLIGRNKDKKRKEFTFYSNENEIWNIFDLSEAMPFV